MKTDDSGPDNGIVILVVPGSRPDWLAATQKLVDTGSVTVLGSASIASDGADNRASSLTGLRFVPLESLGSFARHTGIELAPYILVMRGSRIVGAFEGLWPSPEDVKLAVGSREPVVRRGLMLERLAPATVGATSTFQ
jgi:hypothetical protein